MFGAVCTQLRTGDTLAGLGPPLSMLLRLAPLVALVRLGLKRGWTVLGVGAIACAVVAVVGGTILF